MYNFSRLWFQRPDNSTDAQAKGLGVPGITSAHGRLRMKPCRFGMNFFFFDFVFVRSDVFPCIVFAVFLSFDMQGVLCDNQCQDVCGRYGSCFKQNNLASAGIAQQFSHQANTKQCVCRSACSCQCDGKGARHASLCSRN